MDYALEMSEGKEDEMDVEMCSESCDVDGSQFPGCNGCVEDHIACCG